MAKYHSNGIAPVSFIAGEDMSASANRLKFVALSSSADKVVLGTGGSLPGAFGVLQNSPCAGEEAEIRTAGMFSKLLVNAGTCNIHYGGFLTCASNGYGERQTSASGISCAIALEALTSGSAVIEVYLLPPQFVTSAAS